MATRPTTMALARAGTFALACGAAAACGDSPSDTSLDDVSHDAGALDGPRPRADPGVPPTGDRQALIAWLADGYYRGWTCEPGAHDGRAAVHARVRVCRNDALLHPPSDGDYHVRAAAVAELDDTADARGGIAVLVRGLPDPGPTGWYFYASGAPSAPLALALPIEPDGTIADGYGNAGGNAQLVCAECHAHAPRDFVFGAAALP